MPSYAITAVVKAPRLISTLLVPRIEKELKKPLYRRMGISLEEIRLVELKE